MTKKTLLLSSLLLCFACNSSIPISNISTPPSVVSADEPYANAYQILDGTWKGTFKIFEDQNRQAIASLADIGPVSLEQIKKPSLRLANQIQVQQIYTSESPYFQRVQIKDTYLDAEGKTQVVESVGVNKVQKGQLWCVVQKPDETIIHEGKLEGANTIIWQRHERNPQKVEYFRETVDERFYEIIGYGYYEGDDISLSPKYWFYGRYERVSSK